MSYTELDLQLTDFSDAAAIAGSSAAIFEAANSLGMFMPKGRYSRDEREVMDVAREWVRQVEATIDTLSAGDALTAIGHFDLIHRIAFSRPAREQYINHYILRAFEAHLRGDESVDQYDLYKLVSQQISRRNPAFLGRPLDWASATLGHWYRQFRTGRSTEPLGDYDTTRRVTALVESDLRAYTPAQDTFKRTLLANHRQHLTVPVSIK